MSTIETPKTTIIEQPKQKTALELIEGVAYTTISHWLERRWGPNGATTCGGIYFEPTAQARLAHTFGLITGLKWAGKSELAEAMAEDLFKNLDYLASYGGPVDPKDPDRKRISRFKVQLFDDGTLGGFNIQWYSHVDWVQIRQGCDWFNGKTDRDKIMNDNHLFTEGSGRERKPILAPSWTQYDKPQCAYKRWMHGGLIYHGPGAGETFTTNFAGHQFWGIHT